MKTNEDSYKVIQIQKRFLWDYEYVVGSEQTKSFIKKIGIRRGKNYVFDDPTFELK
jgi:hypothetical protein